MNFAGTWSQNGAIMSSWRLIVNNHVVNAQTVRVSKIFSHWKIANTGKNKTSVKRSGWVIWKSTVKEHVGFAENFTQPELSKAIVVYVIFIFFYAVFF